MSSPLIRLLLVAPLLLGGPAVAEPPVVAIVVHPTRAETPTLAQVRQIYLRQRRFWTDRTPILPVGLQFGTPGRTRFDQRVFGAQASDLGHYWDEQYFQGVLPPPTLASDEAVREYVAARPAAIGYLDLRFVDETVRVIAKLE